MDLEEKISIAAKDAMQREREANHLEKDDLPDMTLDQATKLLHRFGWKDSELENAPVGDVAMAIGQSYRLAWEEFARGAPLSEHVPDSIRIKE